MGSPRLALSKHVWTVLLVTFVAACASGTGEPATPEPEDAGETDMAAPEDAAEDVPPPDVSGDDVPAEPDTSEPQTYTPANPGQPSPLTTSYDCVPSEEVCDGLDNDCNSLVDDNIACACTSNTQCYGGPPITAGQGRCRVGVRACEGEFFGICNAWVGPAEEICGDGVDGDCDGLVDEGCCKDFEICGDGIDNNCDGTVDNLCSQESEETFTVGVTVQDRPVDIIMVVDNSGSMRDTAERVESNLNEIATVFRNRNVDYRFAVISRRGNGGTDVCMQPPLAGDACADTETFRHLNQPISQGSLFYHSLLCFDQCEAGGTLADFIRPDSLLQFVMISDNDSSMSWEQFFTAMASMGRRDFVVHTSTALTFDRHCIDPGDRGITYVFAAEQTGGETFDICEDWADVTDDLFDSTLTQLRTTFTLERRPIPETIRVSTRLEGTTTETASPLGEWTYDQTLNTVRFRLSAAPTEGIEVVIRYTTIE